MIRDAHGRRAETCGPTAPRLLRSTRPGQGGAMSSRRAQLVRLRRVAVAALDLFPLPSGKLTFVDHGENTTFRHDSAAGRHLVRVHRTTAARPGRRLHRRHPLRDRLATGHPDGHRAGSSRNRSRPATAHPPSRRPQPGRPGSARCCAGWTDASMRIRLVRSTCAGSARRWPACTTRPTRGRRLPDFVRIRWDHETFFGNVMVYGETPAADCWTLLPEEVHARFRTVDARMADVMPRVDVGRAHPRRPAPRQRALPARRGQADRLRRLRHRPPALRPRRRPLGAAGRTGLPGVPGRAARRVIERAGRSTSPTWTTSSRFGRSRSTSGTPAPPRSILPSPRGSTGSTAGRWRCSTWWPSPETSRPDHPRCMNIQR